MGKDNVTRQQTTPNDVFFCLLLSGIVLCYLAGLSLTMAATPTLISPCVMGLCIFRQQKDGGRQHGGLDLDVAVLLCSTLASGYVWVAVTVQSRHLNKANNK